MKRWLGFAKVRCRGLARNTAHLNLLVIAYNMRRAMKLAH
jgi:IS5 family transposase